MRYQPRLQKGGAPGTSRVMSPLVAAHAADKVTIPEINYPMPSPTHLPNAPLVFVLGVVRISNYPNFAKKFENLHEALLEQFPERQDIGGFSLTGFDETGRPRFEQNQLWRIFNRISNSSLLLGNGQFVFEWSHYESFEYAMQGSLESLHSIFEQLPSLSPTLVGLRYVNVLMDNDPQPIDKAVIPELLGFRLDNTNLISSDSSTAQQFNSGAKLETRFSRGLKKPGEIVTPSGVAVPSVLSPNEKLQKFINFGGRYGLLDLDGVLETKVDKRSAEDIFALFSSLRNDMRPVLKSLVDEKTYGSWS